MPPMQQRAERRRNPKAHLAHAMEVRLISISPAMGGENTENISGTLESSSRAVWDGVRTKLFALIAMKAMRGIKKGRQISARFG